MRRTARPLAAAGALLMSVSLLAGCGGGSTSAAPDGEVPDPCTLLSTADTIEPVLGVDPGAPSMTTEDPKVRKVCLYAAGVFLEIEIAANYEQSVAAVEDPATGATTQKLTGVGVEAILASYGEGINQVVALAGEYYIGVTGVMSPEQATDLATAMVEAVS
ncbi:MAG: hypothetical protein PSX37_04200 [bacterium]|nr:hypothetical protein [bacterium]